MNIRIILYKGAFIPTGAHVWPSLNTFEVPTDNQCQGECIFKIHSIITAEWIKNGLELEARSGGEEGWDCSRLCQLISALGEEVFSSQSGTGLAWGTVSAGRAHEPTIAGAGQHQESTAFPAFPANRVRWFSRTPFTALQTEACLHSFNLS